MLGDLIPRYDMRTSVPKTNNAPKINPAATGAKENFPYSFDSSAISIAGFSNDQYDAAVITPLANPRLASKSLR